MATKDNLLTLLEAHKTEYLSGEEVGQKLGVSRNSIWKAVQALRLEGWRISASTNKGYALLDESDVLSEQGIRAFLPKQHPFELKVTKTIDSTNEEIRRLALQGAKEGLVVIAEEQTAGRGREGKAFFSPAGTGLYLSILLHPRIHADKVQFLTCAAAVATAQAIEEVSSNRAQIKWVNDIFCDGKKVAGILTEGNVDMESGALGWAICGIGINVKPPKNGFPADLSSVATALYPPESTHAVRNRLVAEIIKRFWSLYQQLGAPSFYQEYRDRCFLIGKQLSIVHEGERINARATGLTRDFKLVVELPDKSTLELPYGQAHPRATPAQIS